MIGVPLKTRIRGLVALLALVLAAVTPGVASAVAPTNDTQVGAAPVTNEYSVTSAWSVQIPAISALGGWYDATVTEDSLQALPSCLGQTGYRSMWYLVDVTQSSVLTVALASSDSSVYRPLVTISSVTNGTESACSVGGITDQTAQVVSASSYVSPGYYYVRIASARVPDAGPGDSLPTLTLSAWLRDVTPPAISVAVSKSVGVNKRFTFDATGSTDAGSQIDPATAIWTFYDGGAGPPVLGSQFANPLIATHSWRTPGLHRVTLLLRDNNNNATTYTLNVFVHSFVPPKVSMRVLASKPGSRTLRLVLKHDMPVKVRLVILQSGTLLRTIPSKLIKGKRKTTISIPLKAKIAKTGFLIVSGTASDLSDNPNTVALKMCSVRPGKAGGVCA